MDIDNFKEEDWDLWVLASSVDFKDQDIFIMSTGGLSLNFKLIYKAIGDMKSDRHLFLQMRWFGQWHSGHTWSMKGKTAVRFPLIKIVSKLNVIPCCNICHITNEFAEPNQKDGSYICFNCR